MIGGLQVEAMLIAINHYLKARRLPKFQHISKFKSFDGIFPRVFS
jgi:hypothetical protein